MLLEFEFIFCDLTASSFFVQLFDFVFGFSIVPWHLLSFSIAFSIL